MITEHDKDILIKALQSRKNDLSNLLAIIHSDGGHYEAENGTEKAVKDAKDKVLLDRSDLSEIRSAFRLHFAVAPDDPLMITVPERELFILNAPMPCGHLARYSYKDICLMCELEKVKRYLTENGMN